MKQLMVDNNTAASHSFLLDDDSSIPFSLDDIAALMEDKVRPWHALIMARFNGRLHWISSDSYLLSQD
jgi:hypothetical protein